MQCPACRGMLKTIESGGVAVDACVNGCGGIWFDQRELDAVDEPHESAGGSLLAEIDCAFTANGPAQVDHNRPRACPKCADMLMMRHYWSALHAVEIDECPACAGIWLDAGELASIRHLNENPASLEAATVALLDQIQHDLEKLDAESDQQVNSFTERIRRIFKLL